MTAKYMLDTNVVSAIVSRRSEKLLEKVTATPPGQFCVSAITAGEIEFGLALRPEATRLRHAVSLFMAEVNILPWNGEVALSYGRLRARLVKAGLELGSIDMLIAAHSLHEGRILVTNDKAFFAIPGFAVEDWNA